MEILSTQFFAALAAIVVIDLVLAGDNAIVIALAARNLPDRLRKRAIIWGTIGAIGVRAALTAVVVWLLKIPGLMAAGGLMLLWIAYRLLVPTESGGGNGHESDASASFWGAMSTIVVADAMMGLDNVLAVAGAAQGSYLLVVLGLLISIPIVVWGSRLVLKLIDRFPAIVYVGAAVLALTAAKMVTGEPAVALALADHDGLRYALYGGLTVGVLALAALRNSLRRQDRLAARLFDSGMQAGEAGWAGTTRILVPVDGSRRSLEALHAIARRCPASACPEIHLVNVQHPISRHVAAFLRRADVSAWQSERGQRAMAGASALLSRLGVAHERHVRVGARANAIAQAARELGCERIVMASARRNSLTRLVDDSVTEQVLQLSDVPIEVIATAHRSRIETFGYAAGVGAAFGLATMLMT